jgi:putative peptide zinc metalloprotease protein
MRSRPGVVKLRPDIEWSQRITRGRRRWLAYDPVASAFFYFNEFEYTVLQLLDGSHSPISAVAAAQRRLPIESWSPELTGRFFAKLDQSGLLLSRSVEDSANRQKRIHRDHLIESRASWFNWAAIRHRWGDPTVWVSKLDPLAEFLFRKNAAFLLFLCSLPIWLSVVLRCFHQPGSLTDAQELLQGNRWIGLLSAYVVAKVIHELGHLLACRRFRVPCREVGIVWLFFVPCFYCDTTESWRLADPRQRATIAAGGIYFEWLLASLAALGWLILTPGPLQAAAANLTIVCSIGTFLINANPLVRYDGYYILSDWWGVPNLAEQSREVLSEASVAWMTHSQLDRHRWDASPMGLACFGIASAIYRNILLAGILYGTYHLLEPKGLGLIAVLLILSVVLGMLLTMRRSLGKFLERIRHSHAASVPRIVLSLIALLGFAWLFTACPIPNRILARGYSRFIEEQVLFANRQSELVEQVTGGSRVSFEQKVIELDDPELDLSRLRLAIEIECLEVKLDSLQARSVNETHSAAEVETLKKLLETKREQQTLLDEQSDRLHICANLDGIVMSGKQLRNVALTDSTKRAESHRIEDRLATKNFGSSVDEGTILGSIVDIAKIEMETLVDDGNASRLAVGMKAWCRFDAAPSRSYSGTVRRISPEPIVETPELLIGDPLLVSITDSNGKRIPERPHHSIIIALDQSPYSSIRGSKASMLIETRKETVFAILLRWIETHMRW